MCSTPLHAFFSLGLMQGPYRGGRHVIAFVNQPAGARDYLLDALRSSPAMGDVSTACFTTPEGLVETRRTVREIEAFAAQLKPANIAVGNDRRLEFHAAVSGCPAARRTYIDDGLFSYLPRHDKRPAWREAVSSWIRSAKYGCRVEHPSMVGGSRAVQEAYVLIPSRVHGGLAGKPVHPFVGEWFATPAVMETCSAAVALAGLDATQCAAIRLLLLLPHPRFLRAHPALADMLADIARSHAERGVVALKPHPRADRISLSRELRLPERGIVELPARLPAEVLIPLLTDATVVGTLTTALLSLALLGSGLSVRSLLPPGRPGGGDRYAAAADAIFRAAGIVPLQLPR
jgi:hypothetical protein